MLNRLFTDTTAVNNTLRLPAGELTFDTEAHALRLHDGETLGGFEAVGVRAYNPPPGPETLRNGDTTLGYYGLSSASEYPWTSEDVVTATGFSQGNPTYGLVDWMKFAFQGKTLYIPLRPIRTSVSWAQLYQAGLVYGVDGSGPYPYPTGSPVNQNTRITLDGRTYLVRLMTGGQTDSSEWQSLMYRVNNGTWASYSLGGLAMTAEAAGRGNWVQEGSGSTRTQRGAGGRVSGYYNDSVTSTSDPYGWRPVLELVT